MLPQAPNIGCNLLKANSEWQNIYSANNEETSFEHQCRILQSNQESLKAPIFCSELAIMHSAAYMPWHFLVYYQAGQGRGKTQCSTTCYNTVLLWQNIGTNMWNMMVLTLPGHVVEFMQDVILSHDLTLKWFIIKTLYQGNIFYMRIFRLVQIFSSNGIVVDVYTLLVTYIFCQWKQEQHFSYLTVWRWILAWYLKFQWKAPGVSFC